MSDTPASDRLVLEFERPIIDLEKKIAELRGLSTSTVDFSSEIRRLEQKSKKLQREIFADLTAQQKVQLSRHPGRPYTLDYLSLLTEDFVELHGDRGFHDDPAIVGGMARFDAWEVLVLGHQKGRNTKENLHRNFGMARPEGYRKATRLMRMAARFGRPILCFIDTPGAYPGLGAEERGQAEAIARSTEACLALGAPNVALVIGEGGSGGAIAVATANKVLMLEHSVYSVISPEGAASILWRDSTRAQDAATAMKITAQDLLRFGIIDEIVPEPVGGAHRDRDGAVRAAGDAIERALASLAGLGPKELRDHRAAKFEAIGRSLG